MGNANKLILRYLTDRPQFVCINNHNSKILPFNLGAPQGSILGSMVFLIYVIDLPHVISCSTTLFSGDTCLLIQACDPAKLERICNNGLVNIEKWMASSKLTITPNKCQILPILYSPKKCLCFLHVLINNQLVSPTSTAKFSRLATQVPSPYCFAD